MNALLKNDKYRKSRGGHSRWLLLICNKCGSSVAVYQKDGPGMLKRLYLDRIIAPKTVQGSKNFMCKKCKAVLGIKYIYEKERRLAYRVFAGAIEKKIIKQVDLLKFKF